MRYNKTERLGVLETDKIITKDIDWIFREQPIIDVGLDAIIEQSENGNPTGKFLAVQIKSGKGNFLISEKKLTYYVSHIHYHYWLNLDIPIILVAHLPEIDKTFWQQINEQNLKKTKKYWKLEIPLNQELSLKAKNKLTEILSSKSDNNFVFELYSGKVEPYSIFDVVENVNCISESTLSINNFNSLLSDFTEKTNSLTTDIHEFSKNNLSIHDLEVKARFQGFSRQMNITSKKIENEIIIFSKLYSEGFYAYEQVILLNFLFTNNSKELGEAIESINAVPPATEKLLIALNSMRNSIAKLPNNISLLKTSKINLLEIIDMILIEFKVAKEIALKIIENFNNEKLICANK